MAASLTVGTSGVDETNVRELVHNCMESDDITSLLRLMFDAQARAAREGGKVANMGKETVAAVSSCLRSFAEEQERVIEEVCRANAPDIAQCVSEMHDMRSSLKDLNTSITSHSDAGISAGRQLVENSRELRDLVAVQENIVLAVNASKAAQKVLDLCMDVAEHVEEHRLYQALRLLDAIRQTHLPALFSLLASKGTTPATPHERPHLLPSSAPSSPTKPTPTLIKRAASVNGQDAVRLRRFFEGLVDELTTTVDSLAVGDFNNWLVQVRADARQIGMRAIRKAASERQLEEDLTRERKVVLQQLADVRDVLPIVAEVVRAPFRREVQQEAAQQAAEKDSEQGLTQASPRMDHLTTSSSTGSSSRRREKQQLLRPLAARIAARVAAATRASSGAGAGPTGVSTSSVRLVEGVDMRPLHRCVHVQGCLGKLEAFRERYLEQRQLQITTDLQPPGNFLEAYQAYLSQVAGFFIVEDMVQRVAEGLVSSHHVHLLWEAAAGALKAVLDRELGRVSSPSIMLLVKDFVLLLCTALAQCGYNVVPVQEILLGSRARYHDLLATALTSRITNLIDSDVLIDYEIRTRQMHKEVVDDLGLPSFLEGAKPQEPPYVAPFTSSVPALLQVLRGFVGDSLSYLRGMFGPWELLPAVYHHRDTMLTKVVVAALMVKISVVSSGEMLRECMKMTANVWALLQALDAIDAWTEAQVRPTGDKEASIAAQRAARNRKANTLEGAGSNVQAALRSAQDAAERSLLRLVAARVESLLDTARTMSWAPNAPLPPSPYVEQLLSFLQETFEYAQNSMPRSSFSFLARTIMRSASIGFVRVFTGAEVRQLNVLGLQRLAGDVAAVQRFAGATPVANLPEELAEPRQLCGLMLEEELEAVLMPEVRKQKYAALELPVVALVLDKYKELPASKVPPGLRNPRKKAVDSVAKQLREQMLNGASMRGAMEDD